MKKFRFTLAKLKEFREHTLESEKNELGIMRARLTALENELAELYRLIEAKNAELKQIMEEGTSPLEISTIKRFIAAKQQDIVVQKSKIARQQREIEKQLQVVIERTQDVKMLEKLEESQLEEYRALELKEQEQFIEEFVSNADFRKNN